MKQFLLLIMLLLGCSVSFAQSEWQANRKPYPDKGGKSDLALRYYVYSIHYDYKYDEEGTFICDITYHAITKAYNDVGLQSTNRIYIGLSNVIDVLEVKSRVLRNDGSVIELDQSNIKEIEDEETDGGYKIFAVEGAEIGSEIEYLYTKRVYGSTFINEPIQFHYPIEDLEFTLTCPENLEFEFNVANVGIEVPQIDSSEIFNQYQIVLNDIPNYEAEPFSGFDSNKMRIDFRLAYNSVAGKKRINTYSDAGKRIYDITHDLSKDEKSIIEDFIKENDLKTSDAVLRLKHLEHALKVKSYMEENVPDDVTFLFSNGFGSRIGFLKIFVAIAEYLAMDYEVVATSDRFSTKFETDFSSWNYLDDYLLYFPEKDKYLSVHEFDKRYGSVAPKNTATLAIFIHPEIITDFEYPITRIDYIEPDSYLSDMNNIDIEVSFEDEFSKAILKAKRTFTGNQADYFKSLELWMDDDQYDQVLKEQAEFLAADGEIIDIEIQEINNSAKNWNDPFILNFSSENHSFIEYAGDKVLFKAGQLIGLQSELYKSEKRSFQVENTNNRGYLREITIKIPSGYEIQNLDDIILEEKVEEDDEPVYFFESSYSLDNNFLKISIVEYYDQIFYPKSGFEDFRRVINAAADWNKVTLIFNKIK